MQAIATFLFFAVFIMLFIALSLYLGTTTYTFFRKGRKEQADSSKTEKHS